MSRKIQHWLYILSVTALTAVAFQLWHRNESRHEAPVIASSVLPPVIRNEPITPLPANQDLQQAKVSLGEQLFHDPLLSGDNTISCASCHSLATGGTDQLVHSIGVDGKKSSVNSPTVFNSGLNFVQFWDGRAATLEEQIDGPLNNPDEMDSNWDDALRKLRESSAYVNSFAAVYSDGIQAANVRDAIATFERSLTTPNSRFDRYLRGENNALTAEEYEGYRLFKDYGCTVVTRASMSAEICFRSLE